ncbi:MAG: helix-turn-helix transcriptional regulator [Mariprofundales bacterium]
MNSRVRVYAHYNREAVALLGGLVQQARKERKLTAQDVADRVGISRTTLRRIEQGDMKCEIGLVFEVAALVGVQLFNADVVALGALRRNVDDRLALLPKTVHLSAQHVDDDF